MSDLNVDPRFPIGDIPRLRPGNSKDLSKAIGRFSVGISPSKFNDLRIAHLSSWMLLSRTAAVFLLSSLADHVINIVLAASGEQVKRVAARRVIAPMAAVLSGSKHDAEKLYSDAGGHIVPTSLANAAIAIPGGRTKPRPTSLRPARSVDFFPKMKNELWGILGPHCKLLTCDAVPPAVDAARGFSVPNFTTNRRETYCA